MGEAQWPGPSARGGIGKESPGALWLAKGPRSLNQQFGRRRLWASLTSLKLGKHEIKLWPVPCQ